MFNSYQHQVHYIFDFFASGAELFEYFWKLVLLEKMRQSRKRDFYP